MNQVPKNARSTPYFVKLNLVGQKFGRLTVISRSHELNKRWYWLCKCECGKEKLALASNLRRGEVRSCGCMLFLPDEEATHNHLYSTLKGKAKSRKHIFTLDKDVVWKLSQSPCFYCGINPQNKLKIHTRPDLLYSGLDRVDSSKGYTPDNVVACCYTCNTAKNSMSFAEFLCWISRVHDHVFGVFPVAAAA